MAKVLALLCSGRRKGYTATVLRSAVEGAESVEGVKVDWVRLQDYELKPCTSCFHCIRDAKRRCPLDDDFGRMGKGRLLRKLKRANGIILADPVHMWGATATCHLFVERTYAYHWTKDLRGMPLITFSCATNQGFQLEAQRTLTRWAFTGGYWYLGGLPVHAAYFDEALKEAGRMGKKLGRAAVRDATRGRKTFSEAERFRTFLDAPWSAFDHYIENLSNGTYRLRDSLPERALKEGTFHRPEAVELLTKARDEFAKVLTLHKKGEEKAAIRHLVRASSFWTHATWLEFLEQQAIKARPPETYRPLPG
ncbi:MAG: flavodoxin family protein [Planctomycetes bacterium]|nr:flavodoxin family protein [Planctomycetota bacterium]